MQYALARRGRIGVDRPACGASWCGRSCWGVSNCGRAGGGVGWRVGSCAALVIVMRDERTVSVLPVANGPEVVARYRRHPAKGAVGTWHDAPWGAVPVFGQRP